MRLRDAAMALSGYMLRRSRDVEYTTNCKEDNARRAGGTQRRCSENAESGAMNGRKTGQLAISDAADCAIRFHARQRVGGESAAS